MPENPSEKREERPARLLEDVFIILCILTLWPVILHWRHPAFEFLLYAALAGLVVIFWRRVRRFRQAGRDLQD